MKSRNDTVMKRYSNNKSYDQVKGTKKYEMKGKIEMQNMKTKREILDNYRYIEIKNIKTNDERKKSIVRHRRLGQPIGKETLYEKERFSTQTNYITKRPIINDIKKVQNKLNERNYRKTTVENSKNYSTEKNNSQYRKISEKMNNSLDKSKKQIISSNYKTAQSQINMHNYRTNTQNNQNTQISKEKPYINKETIKYLYQEEKKNDSHLKNNNRNQNNKNGNNSAIKPKEKIESTNINQNGVFKYPQENKNIQTELDKDNAYPNMNLEICETCGKPKRLKGEEKLKKVIVRELIGEKSNNDYIIRYGMENETQNEPYFETFRAPGTRFCPIHGYV